jgi:hypothetical protein
MGQKLIIILFVAGICCGVWYGIASLYYCLRFPNAQIIVSPKTKFDFGIQEPGISVTHTFEITNVGRQVVKIEKVIPECSCSAAKLDKTILKKGESANINIKLDTTSFYGLINKKVLVITSPMSSKPIQLEMSGTVNFALTPSSRIVDFTYSKKDYTVKNKYAKFEVSTTTDKRVASLIPRTNTVPNYLEISVSPKNETSFIVTVGLNVEKAPVSFNDHLILEDCNKACLPFRLTVRGSSEDGYMSLPDIIYLGVIQTNEVKEYIRRIAIHCLRKSYQPDPNQFKAVEVFPKNVAVVKVNSVELRNDNNYIVSLLIKPNIPDKTNGNRIQGVIRFSEITDTLLEVPLCYYLTESSVTQSD